jgi:lipopolysaccharide cholinephosphotransferase
MSSSHGINPLCLTAPRRVRKYYKRQWYDKIEYVPFEDTQVPIPSEYDKILQMEYGDWRTPVKQKTLHSGMIIDPDISYIEWFKRNRS